MTRLQTLFATLAAAALITSACSTSGSKDSARIEPIGPILASDIEIIADPSGTSATFAVDTTIPVACAVIYGTDDGFGSIAVDNDMQGGAHQDHGPSLTSLTPDTEYQYVLQGSDAAGTIYRSDTLAASMIALRRARNGEIHIEASWIFTANDIKINGLVIATAFIITATSSRYPDLIVVGIIFAIAANGARRILKLARQH